MLDITTTKSTTNLSEEEKDSKIQEFLTRAVDNIYPNKEMLDSELRSGRRLTAYLGIDPTAPDIHVGHVSQLYKLKRLQDLGHRIILLIGDFTAMIGDPTGKGAARIKLTSEQVLANAKSYKEQAGKILDFNNPTNPIELKFNSKWLSQMNFNDILELTSEFTLQQIIERDMFQKRIKENKPVGLHEFLYPLMQGWDSVAMEVDIEVGGSDQIFNMLVGSELVKRHLNKQKFVVAGKLLVDPSGKKIGKTEGNMITISDSPEVTFHKIMMWGDAIIPHALELSTSIPMDEISLIDEKLNTKEMDGITGKKILASRIISELHSIKEAEKAQKVYSAIAEQDKTPTNIEELSFNTNKSILDIIVETSLASSKSEAKRLVQQNGVRIDKNTISDINYVLQPRIEGYILQVGKKQKSSFRKISIS